jgi:acetyl esterase
LPPDTGDIAGRRASYAAERAYWNQPVIQLDSVTDGTLRLDAGTVAMRVYRPTAETPLPTLVYLHGGGFVVGSLDTHDRIMRQICRRSGAVVIGIDYPLSPERRSAGRGRASRHRASR